MWLPASLFSPCLLQISVSGSKKKIAFPENSLALDTMATHGSAADTPWSLRARIHLSCPWLAVAGTWQRETPPVLPCTLMKRGSELQEAQIWLQLQKNHSHQPPGGTGFCLDLPFAAHTVSDLSSRHKPLPQVENSDGSFSHGSGGPLILSTLSQAAL